MGLSSNSSTRNAERQHGSKLGTLYFVPETDASVGHGYSIHHSDLVEAFKRISESHHMPIRWIAVYRSALWPFWKRSGLFYHVYILFKTDGWCYSLETSRDKKSYPPAIREFTDCS